MKATALFGSAARATFVTRSTTRRTSSLLVPILRRSTSASSTPLAFRTSTLKPRASFSTSRISYKGILPESSEPQPPKTDSSHGSSPAQISDAEYHEIADQYLDTLVLALEELSESRTDGLEVEFSVRPLCLSVSLLLSLRSSFPPLLPLLSLLLFHTQRRIKKAVSRVKLC